MKKKLTILALATTMICGSAVTTFAADTNPAGGNTDVFVGVATAAPSNISVTVPTTLAIAVVDDTTKLETLMGNYIVDNAGKVINSGDSVNGIKDQRVTFINTGDTDAKVISAKIINPKGSKWTLKDTATAKYQMSMKLNTTKSGDINPDQNAVINLGDFALPNNQITHMGAEVKAGGVAGDYTAIEESAKAFVIEWNIAAK